MRSPVTMDETNSLYSVDQDGFFTTMHTDIHLAQDNQSLDDSPDLEEEFAKLSLLGSSTNTSTHTLNDSAKTPTSNHNGSSLGSFPDSEQAEEISQRVQLKVEAGRTINRYSLVMKLSEDEDDDEAFAEQTPTRRSVSKDSQSHLTRSQTYESELDLVLEDLSDAETGTIHSDVESIVSVKLPGTAPVTSTPVESADTESYSSKHDLTVKSPSVMTSGDQVAPHDQLLRYKLLNGCTKYQKITPTSAAVQSAASQSTVGQSIQTEGEESRSYKSLPRNIKHHVTSGGHLNGLLSTLDNMGSWPRKLSKINAGLSKESQPKDSELSKPVAQTSTVSSQSKRRSISPGKLKLNTSSTNQKTEKIHSLIEEARRMSSTDITVKRPLSRPLSQPESTFNSITSTPGTHPQADTVSPYASCSVLTTPPKSQVENFIRQPSYKLACSHQETPRGYLPRSFSEEPKSMRRNFSYRLANSSVTSSTNDTVPEDKVLDTYTEGPGFVRAPSYKMAQTTSFDRKLRAPSYRRAVETLHSEFDSGLGSGDMTSSGSLMTSSSDSAHSDHSIGRPTQLKTSTEGVYSPPDGPPVVLHHAVIKECMKGVYENEEVHLPRKLTVPSKPELVSISMNSESHHYSVPRVPAQPTSFHPTYANIEYGGKSKQAHKKYLQPSKSAPAPPTESKDTTRSISAGVAMTPPTRSSNRKQRPMSSYMPNGNEESENIVPDSRLMLPKYNQSSVFFPSMEMLKREEMAVKSVLGKIKRSTRPLSYVQTDI